MTKENFINKWCRIYEINTTKPAFIADLDAVIATEIAKAQEQPQPELNPIEQAYERGEKIRHNDWAEGDWILKYDETKCISRNRLIQSYKLFSQKINTHPHDWELYTEPEQTKPFDKDRFERMFCAVVASGGSDVLATVNKALKQLDAYYADKEKGGNNE